MGRILWQILKGFCDNGFDMRIFDRPGRPGPGLFAQTVQPLLDRAPAPLVGHYFYSSELGRHLFVLRPFRASQDDFGS